jgi:hypothetical protein
MYPARWFRRSIPRSGIGLAIALSLATQASDALACACCSEPGERVESSGKLDPYEKPELERLRFAKTAHLYLTAAGFEGVSGIADPASTYALGFSRAGERWTFTFKDAKGAASTLAFTLPSKIESFFVDPRGRKASVAADPVLYKEWRLEAPATATGSFAAKGSGTARLILHGRGNACTSADQFTAWTLEVNGPGIRYRLFGDLLGLPPAP